MAWKHLVTALPESTHSEAAGVAFRTTTQDGWPKDYICQILYGGTGDRNTVSLASAAAVEALPHHTLVSPAATMKIARQAVRGALTTRAAHRVLAGRGYCRLRRGLLSRSGCVNSGI